MEKEELDQIGDLDSSLRDMHTKLSSIENVQSVEQKSKKVNHEDGTLRWFYALQSENSMLKRKLNDLLNSKHDRREQEVRKLESLCFKKRQELDNLKNKNKNVGVKIKKLEKKLGEFQFEEVNTKNFTEKEKYIRMLENRLDKAIMKLNESQVIQDTYNKLTKKLKQERSGFDSQLKTIEKSLKIKKRERKNYEEGLRDSKYERDLAKSELNKAKTEFEEIKTHKMKELTDKKKFVQSKLEQTNQFSLKENERMEEIIEENEDDDIPKNSEIEQLENEVEKQQRNLLKKKMENEKLWEKIREVSGEEEVDRIIHKFHSLDEVSKELKESCEITQNKIEDTTKKLEFYKDQLESLTNTKKTRSIGLKRIDDEMNSQLIDAKQVRDNNKIKLKKIKTVEYLILNGVIHLWKKMNILVNSKKEDELKHDEKMEFRGKIKIMLKEIKKCYKKMKEMDDLEGDSEKDKEKIQKEEVFSSVVLSENNNRVGNKNLKKKKRKIVAKKMALDDDFLDVMDRTELKRRSQMTIEKQRKFKKKK